MVPYCRCGNEFSEARARLGFDCCLDCGRSEAAVETARRAHMIVPIAHKSGYTYLGPDRSTQRQRLLEGSAKTPPMETPVRPRGGAAKPQQELVLGPGQDSKKHPAPEGVKGSALTDKQKGMLMDVIAAWVEIVEPNTAKVRLDEIKEKIGDTYFAWKGPTENGSAAYFRVQGPTVWIEYAPQGVTGPQGGTGHIHTVIRNPNDDYGAGTLKAKN